MAAGACRSQQSEAWKRSNFKTLDGEHWGLVLDKFLETHAIDMGSENVREVNRSRLFAAVTGVPSSSLQNLYDAAFARRGAALGGVQETVRSLGRVAVGIGGESIYEVGLTLQHTYGTPVIPGTALKGLAANYCHAVWGSVDGRFKLNGEYHGIMFGRKEEQGLIVFEDAWILPNSLPGCLQPDVMTVHHSNYYQGSQAPTDFDDPTPVTFLSVQGDFLLTVVCPEANAEARRWEQLAMRLMLNALEDWGVGGKTNAGYGRFLPINGSSPGVSASKSAQTRSYASGDKVRVRRVEDPKGKRTFWFEAVEGTGRGTVMDGGAPMDIPMGGEVELTVDSAQKDGAFNLLWPDHPKLQRTSKKGGGKPFGRR